MTFAFIFISGFILAYTISNKLTILEKLALSFPLGFGIASMSMFKADFLLGKISISNLHLFLFITILGCAAVIFFMHIKGIRKVEKPIFKLDLSWLTLPWTVFAAMIVYLTIGITKKCLYWPVAEFDTIQGYDLLSKAIAHEGRLVNSILTNAQIVEGCGPRLLYPPLLALSNSICYMLGMESPRIINVLFFIPWLFILYAFLRRFVSPLASIFFTFLVLITPEMFAHGAFSLTNYPAAIYASTAVFSFMYWRKSNETSFLVLSTFLMAFALWTRSDVVVLTGAFILFSIWIFFKEKKWLPLVLSSLPLISFLVWSVFSKQHIPRAATSFFIKDIFFDVDKLSQVLKTAWEISTSSNTYGLTFSLFFLYLVIHIAIMIFTKTWDNIELLFILLVSWGGYTLLYYQMDNSDGTLFSNGGWMLSGYKRGLFVYAPIALFFVATSYYVKLVFEKLDSALQLFKSKL
jgi:hypothetical protein